jgi:GNAT superfamily N-acetyltransferase
MSIRLARPESDLAGIASVVNAFEREPVSIATVKQWFEYMPPGRIAHRMVATNEHDEVIGYSVATHETWWSAHRFYAWVGVDPQWRQRGFGWALYADANAFLQEQGAAQVASEVLDDDPNSLRFAERNGFTIDRHMFASTLDVTIFDETTFGNCLSTLGATGIRFFTMADVENSPAARRKLYELNHATNLDIPGSDGTDLSFEEFETLVCGSTWYRPDGQLIAADGDSWVGLAAVRLLPEKQGAYNLMTGVLPPYRGRNIALALKLLAIRYARANHARYLSTDNDSLNAPMLAINTKLGYRPQPGRYLLRRDRA